jgi:hypothetical protein
MDVILLSKKLKGQALRGPEHGREDNIKIHLKEFGCGLNSSDSAQGPVAGSCEHGNEPSGSMKGE